MNWLYFFALKHKDANVKAMLETIKQLRQLEEIDDMIEIYKNCGEINGL